MTLLTITDLVKKYGSFTAVDALNLSVDDGCIFGFVGPNGAGKTTTMKIISGLLAATSGCVVIDGVDVVKTPGKLCEKIGYMPDFFGVYDNLKVHEYMDFYCGLYHIPVGQRKSVIGNLLEIVDLTDKTEAYVDSLSRGMKQRLCLARSLVHDPELLILDEPASGLDPRARIEMKEVLKSLKSIGKTIIISSHILPELSELCDQIGIINGGKMVASGTVNEIMRKLSNNRIIFVKPLDQFSALVTLLAEKPLVTDIVEGEDGITFGFMGEDKDLALLLKEIIKNDIPVATFKEKEGNLEEIFMQLT